MVIYVTMVYGPIAAFLVELFPARIRYTSMSLPYHIGNGWFGEGGSMPLLRYPIIVTLMTVVIGVLVSKGDQTHPNPRRALILQRSQGIPGSGAYMASGARCFFAGSWASPTGLDWAARRWPHQILAVPLTIFPTSGRRFARFGEGRPCSRPE
jgi:hypothetical protein